MLEFQELVKKDLFMCHRFSVSNLTDSNMLEHSSSFYNHLPLQHAWRRIMNVTHP